MRCALAFRFVTVMVSTTHPIISVGFALIACACASNPEGLDDGYSAWKRQHAERERAREEMPELSEDAELDQLLAFARANNPGLEAAFLRWQEALELVSKAQSLPDPRVSFSAYLAEVETRTGPMQARVSATQPLPWFGERELAGDIAFEHAEAQRLSLEVARRELELRVRKAWYESAWLEKALSITQVSRELLVHWESVARSRLETGLGKHADVIRAQVELGKLEDRVASLMDLRRPLAAELNAALGRKGSESLPSAQLPEAAGLEIDSEELLAQLHDANPKLRAHLHQIAAAEQAVELAGKEFYPDFFVGADYTFIGSSNTPGVAGSGDDAIAVTLGFDLPIWRSKYRAGVRAAEARVNSAMKEFDEAHLRISADLEMALYRYRDANRRAELFSGSLIPKGEESLRALDLAYQAGTEGFLDLIDAQRVLLEFQLQEARAEADRARSLAEVQEICGELTLEGNQS